MPVYEVPLLTFTLATLSIIRFIGSEAYLSMFLYMPPTIWSPESAINACRPAQATNLQSDHEIRPKEKSGANACQ